MMNFKVSFTTCCFNEAELQEWIRWLKTNIKVTDISTEEVDHASDAEDHGSPAQRVSPKRVGR